MLAFAFKFDRETGEGMPRYVNGLWEYFKTIPHSAPSIIDKVELGYAIPSQKSVLYSAWQLSTIDFSGYDILHTVEPIVMNPVRKGRANTVTTMHDVPKFNLSEHSVPYYIASRMRRRQLVTPDYIIAASTFTRKFAVEVLHYDINRIFHVSLWVPNKFVYTPLPKRKGKGFTVGTIGSLTEGSHVDSFIRAAKMVKSRDVKFEICGKEGPESATFRRLAGGDRRINFKGYIPEKDFLSVVDSLDVGVFPTLYEGFGLTHFELMARGIPVIVFNKAAIPDETRKGCISVEDEQELADKIDELRRNGFSEKTRKRIMDYAKDFTWENTAKNTLKVYEKIAKMG